MIRLGLLKKTGVLRLELNNLLSATDIKGIKEVYIKPNLGGRYPVLPGENTSVEFMWDLCLALKEFGVKKIKIGHDSLLNFGRDQCSFADIIKTSRYDRLNQIEGVELVHLGMLETCDKKVNGVTFDIPKFIFDTYYLNVAVLKTHMETTVSLTLKNQMGLIAAKNRMTCHKLGLHKFIGYLGTVLKPNLNFIDGLVAMQGNGPHHGTPIRCNCVLMGNDMVELDSIGATLMGFDYKQIKHLSFAQDLGVGRYPVEQDLDAIRKVHFTFRKPNISKIVGRTFIVWPTTACSGCIFALNRAKQMALVSKNPKVIFQFLNLAYIKITNIVIGTVEGFDFKEMAGKKNLFVLGDCAKKFVVQTKQQRFLPGCPPRPEQILEFLTSTSIANKTK